MIKRIVHWFLLPFSQKRYQPWLRDWRRPFVVLLYPLFALGVISLLAAGICAAFQEISFAAGAAVFGCVCFSLWWSWRMIVIFNTRFSASSASAFREELATRNRFKDAQGRADVFQDVFLQKRDMVNPLAQTLSVCELREVIFELLQQAEGAAISQLLQLTLIELTKALPANDEALSEILKQSKAKNLQRVLHHFGVDEPEATTSMSDGAKKTSAPGVGLQPKRPGE